MANTGEDESGAEDRDELLVAALAAGSTYSRAAEIAGTSPRTVRRRMADEDFVERVSAARGQRAAEITGRLMEAAFEAVETLRAGLDAEKPADQLRAAHEILVLGYRYRSGHELEARLRVLEQKQKEEEQEEANP